MSSSKRKFCAHCGMEIPLESDPVFCPHCGVRISDITPPVSSQSGMSGSAFSWNEGGYTVGRTSQPFSFSRIEIRDILVAWIALSVSFTAAITGGLLGGFKLQARHDSERGAEEP